MGQSWPAGFVPWYKKYSFIHGSFRCKPGMLLLVYTVSRKHHFCKFLWCRYKTWTRMDYGLDYGLDFIDSNLDMWLDSK